VYVTEKYAWIAGTQGKLLFEELSSVRKAGGLLPWRRVQLPCFCEGGRLLASFQWLAPVSGPGIMTIGLLRWTKNRAHMTSSLELRMMVIEKLLIQHRKLEISRCAIVQD
jgi:hypothetical protein